MGFALNKFVDCFNGVFRPKKTGWVRAFRGKPIFVLVFDESTVTVGLYKLDVGLDSWDLNKRRPTTLVSGPAGVVDAKGRALHLGYSEPTRQSVDRLIHSFFNFQALTTKSVHRLFSRF